jgi:nucleoside-diphosphate-sugar epimerase
MKNFSTILITGGAGFIGSHLTDKLIEEGCQVNVIDNLSSGLLNNIRHHMGKSQFHFVRADILDFKTVSHLMKNVDAVFHEAALVSVNKSSQDPTLANDVNVVGTINLLKAALDAGVKRFIYASSAAIYGETQGSKITEDTIPKPMSAYGASKLAAENYAYAFFKTQGLETVSLRYFNIYGPRQRFDSENTYGGVISTFTNRLIHNKPPVIHGDGSQTRDFVYIDDVVEANMLALQSKNSPGEAFNIGTGESISVNKLANLLKKITKHETLQNAHAPAPPESILHSCANITKARSLLGYQPKTNIEDGLTKLTNWAKTRTQDTRDSPRKSS